MRFYRDFMPRRPRRGRRAALAFITAPPEEFVPEPVRGQPVVGVIVLLRGDVEDGEGVVRAPA